jgi:hypothetical protein
MQSNCRKKNISDIYFVIRYILACNDRKSDIYVYYVIEYWLVKTTLLMYTLDCKYRANMIVYHNPLNLHFVACLTSEKIY